MKKVIIFLLSAIILLSGIYFAGSGLIVRNDVYLADFSVPSDESKITLKVSVSSSAGYIRKAKNVSDEKEYVDLKFYSAFGGINGDVGSKDSFEINLTDESKEIRFFSNADFISVLRKNEETGEWERVK